MLLSIASKYFAKKVIFLTSLHIWIHLLRYCVKISLLGDPMEKLHKKRKMCNFFLGSQQQAPRMAKSVFIIIILCTREHA